MTLNDERNNVVMVAGRSSYLVLGPNPVDVVRIQVLAEVELGASCYPEQFQDQHLQKWGMKDGWQK